MRPPLLSVMDVAFSVAVGAVVSMAHKVSTSFTSPPSGCIELAGGLPGLFPVAIKHSLSRDDRLVSEFYKQSRVV